MARKSPINPEHGWFAGENKILRFTIEGEAATIDGWALTFELFERRTENPPALITKTVGSGVTIFDAANKIADVHILASDTVDFDADTYNYVLRRTDPGSEQVLAFGGALIQRAEVA